jgi:hypothetical protein
MVPAKSKLELTIYRAILHGGKPGELVCEKY